MTCLTPSFGILFIFVLKTFFMASFFWKNMFSEFSRSILSSNSIEDSFDKLTEELDSVLNDTISVIEFNKCLIPDDECHIPAECVETINGNSCECVDMGTGNGINCICSKSWFHTLNKLLSILSPGIHGLKKRSVDPCLSPIFFSNRFRNSNYPRSSES